MISAAFSAPKNFKDALHPHNNYQGYWFIFSEGRLLVSNDKKSIPTNVDLELQRQLCIGTLENKNLLTGEVGSKCPPPQGWLWVPLRALYGTLSEEYYFIAGRAKQLLFWDRVNKHCGSCGDHTFIRANERCRECKSCGNLIYPKLAPVIMALVKRDEKILLARSSHFPEKIYGVLAGYLDLGETLEQGVIREVKEEEGIEVKNIRYFGSQPWPFSYSLIVGFTCDWKEGELLIDEAEIEDAQWFDSLNLPQLTSCLSLARIMIDSNLTKSIP